MENEKTKRKHGLKPFTFFSGVFDIICALIMATSIIMFFVNIMTNLREGNQLAALFIGIIFIPLLIGLGAMAVAVIVMQLIMGISVVISSFKSDRKNWNGLVIATIVIDTFIFFVLLILVFGTKEINPFLIVLLVLTVVEVIFKSIDLCLIKRRIKKYKLEHPEENPNVKVIDFTTLSENKAVQKEEQPQEKTTSNVSFDALKDKNKNDGGEK